MVLIALLNILITEWKDLIDVPLFGFNFQNLRLKKQCEQTLLGYTHWKLKNLGLRNNLNV